MSFLGLMETKSSDIRESMVRKFWCDDDFQWAAVDASNMSGGLLCVWAKTFLNIESVERGTSWLYIRGFMQELDCSVAIIVVYGPHSTEEK